MHSKSFVKGTKMAVVTSGKTQELGYTCIFDASDCFIHIYTQFHTHKYSNNNLLLSPD